MLEAGNSVRIPGQESTAGGKATGPQPGLTFTFHDSLRDHRGQDANIFGRKVTTNGMDISFPSFLSFSVSFLVHNDYIQPLFRSSIVIATICAKYNPVT